MHGNISMQLEGCGDAEASSERAAQGVNEHVYALAGLLGERLADCSAV